MIEPFGHGGRLHVADAVGAVELGELVLQPVFGQCACASETGYAVVPAGQRVGYRRICPESLSLAFLGDGSVDGGAFG